MRDGTINQIKISVMGTKRTPVIRIRVSASELLFRNRYPDFDGSATCTGIKPVVIAFEFGTLVWS